LHDIEKLEGILNYGVLCLIVIFLKSEINLFVMGNFKREFVGGYCEGCGDILADVERGYECLGCGALYGSNGELIVTDGLESGLEDENNSARVVGATLALACQGNGGIVAQRVWGC